MRRILGVSEDETGPSGQWLEEVAASTKPADQPPVRDTADMFPNGFKSMPFLGFGSEDEARRTEKAFLSLSGREATVLAYLAYGHSAKEVANMLKLSCRTVDTFRTRALLKLRARNTADAVRMLASLSALADQGPRRQAAE